MILAFRIEHALDVPVQRAQHSDPRVHQEVPAFRGTDQAVNRGLPFPGLLFGLGQLGDVGGGVLERDQLAAAGKRDRLVEMPGPALRGAHWHRQSTRRAARRHERKPDIATARHNCLSKYLGRRAPHFAG